MRVIFMGTPDFAVGTLEALVKSEHEVVAVVTQPDKPKGRGKAMQPTPVKEVALRENIPVLQPKKVREPEVVEELSKLNADVIVVVAFGQIIPKTILELTKYGCINVHGSLLPKYRGAAPIQWAVIDGEKESGITTMQMDEGLDTGDMLLKKVYSPGKRGDRRQPFRQTECRRGRTTSGDSYRPGKRYGNAGKTGREPHGLCENAHEGAWEPSTGIRMPSPSSG